MDNFIQDNDDIQDNKILSQECYDKSTQIRIGNYTKFHLSDSLIDIINIDKCYLKCNMKYIIEANSESSNLIFDNTLKDLDFFKVFVIFKSVTHNIEVYRIYINNQNIITQNNSIYEQTLVSSMKQNAEMYRQHMYTMLDETHKR